MAIVNWDGDPTALKIILELQRENTLYKRAISDILFILKQKHAPLIPEYDLNDPALSFVFDRLKKLYNPEDSIGGKSELKEASPETLRALDKSMRRMEETQHEEIAKLEKR